MSHLCSPVQREEPAQLAGAGEVNPIHIHMEELFKVGTQLGRAAWGCSMGDPKVFFLVRESETPSESHPSSHVCVERKTQSSWWTLSPACAGLWQRPHCSPQSPARAVPEPPQGPGPGALRLSRPGSRDQAHRPDQGEPKAQQQVHGDEAGLEARWEDILQARVRTEPQLGSQGWAQLHDWEAGLWR